ncbi:MAG TPA: CoA-binding protein [Anaeromyxobacteraceae bacterium]|nr:CoA-binding protein [Anaeromyxobacteraceae bacterium]
MPKTTIERAKDFLAQRRIALVGVSRNPKHFSRVILRELLARGYDVVPVNPLAGEVEGRRCAARVQEIEPPVAGALLVTPGIRTEEAVRDCAEAGIARVWIHRGAGAGAMTSEAVALAERSGLQVVANLCPFMVLPAAAWPHRVHGFVRRLSL